MDGSEKLKKVMKIDRTPGPLQGILSNTQGNQALGVSDRVRGRQEPSDVVFNAKPAAYQTGQQKAY